MIINLDEIKCPIGHSHEDFLKTVQKAFIKTPEGRKIARSKKYSNKAESIPVNSDNVEIVKKSLDARDKNNLKIVFNVKIYIDEKRPDNLSSSFIKENSGLNLTKSNKRDLAFETIIAGSGPAGLFAALALVKLGVAPVIIERGKMVSERIKDVNRFWDFGILDFTSNVQFGEGGAGTFSDGKLNTGIKSPHCREVLETFVDAGANARILYESKPHIGTDILRKVVVNIRKYLISKGAKFYFQTLLTGIEVEDNILKGIYIETKEDDNINKSFIPAQNLILATGHSARDTIRMLYKSGIKMQAKPFSMGVRTEHLQSDIDTSQYGIQSEEIKKYLLPSEYKLSCHLPGGRSAYTFCMCPGGEVIASSSAKGQVVTNGMSYSKREMENANSAVLIGINTGDFLDFAKSGKIEFQGEEFPLYGIDFQEYYENKAFIAGGGNYFAPCEYLGSLLKGKASGKFSDVKPSYRPGIREVDSALYLPSFVHDSLKEAFLIFDNKIKGFTSPGAVITGIESRSSSPVRILRDENFCSNIKGIYPCGEGAGYAGGIMSAAVDGIKAADKVVLTSQKGK